jgi:hypothetical protein
MVPDQFGKLTKPDTDEAVTLLLASGNEWKPFAPSPDDFEWSDITIGASRIPRFGGQLSPKYGVDASSNYVLAQHLCLAHDLAFAGGETRPEILLAVLLHDAEEPLGGLGDPVGPVKHAPRFRELLKAYYAPIIDAIADKAGLARDLLHGDPRIKIWDKQAYKIENWYLRGLRDGDVPTLPAGHRKRIHDEMAIWATMHAHYEFYGRLDRALTLHWVAKDGA